MSQNNPEPANLAGWTPFSVTIGGYEEGVRWVELGSRQFDEPFFADTIGAALRQPGAQVLQTPANALEGFAERTGCLDPCGFIFHMGRTGSTLLAKALKALPSVLVVSEPPPVNQLIRSLDGDPERWEERFRGLIAALGQPRAPEQTRYIVKFTSHCLLSFAAIRRAYPHVPWVFLYREPVEVMVSLLRRPPGWARISDPAAAAALARVPPQQVAGLKPAEFCGLMLGRLMSSALEARPHGGAVINYNQLSPTALEAVTRHFGFEIEAAHRAAVAASFQGHAKGADQPFVPDSEEKRRQATAQLNALCEAWLRAPYKALEAARLPAG